MSQLQFDFVVQLVFGGRAFFEIRSFDIVIALMAESVHGVMEFIMVEPRAIAIVHTTNLVHHRGSG